MFTDIPISVLTEQALLVIRNALMTGNRFSTLPGRNAALLQSISDIDAEFDRRKSQAALGLAS